MYHRYRKAEVIRGKLDDTPDFLIEVLSLVQIGGGRIGFIRVDVCDCIEPWV